MFRVCQVRADRLEYYLGITETESIGAFAEADGYWLGEVRPPFGYCGAVTRADLTALARRRDPITDEPLAMRSTVRYVAFDQTFSAPKGVSLVFALGDPDVTGAVRSAHRVAVDAVSRFIDQRLTVCCVGPSQSDCVQVEVAGKAAFEHRTSRACDPHLHTHLLAANLAQHRDGHWSAFWKTPVYRHVALLGSLYRAALRAELVASLGLRFRRQPSGYLDVDGIPERAIVSFSSRRSAVLDERERLGVAPHSKELQRSVLHLARRTDASYDELCARWWSQAHRLGISQSMLSSVLGRESARELDRRLIDEAASHIRAGFAPRTTHFVLRYLAEHMPQGASVLELETLLDASLAGQRLSGLAPLCPEGSRASLRASHRATARTYAQRRMLPMPSIRIAQENDRSRSRS